MQSLKSKIILGLIRNRHIFSGKLKAPVIDESFDVEDFRNRISTASQKKEKIPADIKVKNIDIDGVYAEWIIPKNASNDKIVMYIHGGGFISGDCLSHRMHMVRFAQKTGVKILQFNYRLAPEHPFPSAVNDCEKVYNFLINQGYKNIVLGGESAGGTLTLSLLMLIKDKNLPYPKAAFSISAVTDLSCKADSFSYNAKKDIAQLNAPSVWCNMYIDKNDYKNKYLSPQFGSPKGFPPLLICVGSYENHLDDCRNFAKKAMKEGVETHFKVYPKMVHAFPLMAPMFKEATHAHDWVCKFIVEKLN